MNAAFHHLCVQPEGAERRALLALQASLDEGIRDIRFQMASRLRELRRYEESLKKAEAAREQIQKKLRGEL